jgi:hypothetical protein
VTLPAGFPSNQQIRRAVRSRKLLGYCLSSSRVYHVSHTRYAGRDSSRGTLIQ